MQARRPRRDVTGILLFDKPLGLSSNAALQQVKRAYLADKAGHTGSLDPLATGVLPICLGEATKLCGVLLDADKSYRARARLGLRTATGDAEGEGVETSDPREFEPRKLMDVLPRFLGTIQQVPPMYSALKHQGQRLYELARAGQEIERQPRQVQILDLRLLACDAEFFEFEVRCSKGTYIRTLAEDWARAAGQCAHLVALRRTAVAPFEHARLISMAELEALQDLADRDGLLLSPAAGLAHWPSVRVDTAEAAALAQGRVVRIAAAEALLGRIAVLDAHGALLGLAETGNQGQVVPKRWLHG